MPVPSTMMGFIETTLGMPCFLGDLHHKFHHDQRPMATTSSYWLPSAKAFPAPGSQGLFAVAAVVCYQNQLVAYRVKLFFQNHQVLGAEARNAVHLRTQLCRRLAVDYAMARHTAAPTTATFLRPSSSLGRPRAHKNPLYFHRSAGCPTPLCRRPQFW